MPKLKRKSIDQKKQEDRQRKKAHSPPHSSSPQDAASLVGDNNTEIPDDVIEFALKLMRTFSDTPEFIGYYTPAHLHWIISSPDSIISQPIIPPDCFSINIHPLPGHWVTSCQLPQLQQIHVYDSLMSQEQFRLVIQQLQIIYGHQSITRIQYKTVTQQSSFPICGIMAIAFAFSCFLGEDCSKLHYDLKLARDHLRQCITNQHIQSFPTVQGTTMDSTRSCQIHSYFADQLCRSKLHQDTIILSKNNTVLHDNHKGSPKNNTKEKVSNYTKERENNRQRNYRKCLTEIEKDAIRFKDNFKKQYKRNILSVSEGNIIKIKDKKRKLQARDLLSNSKKRKIQEQDMAAHKSYRNSLDEIDKASNKKKNARDHKERRQTLGEVEKATLQHKDTKQHKQRTLTMSEPEKATIRHKNAKQHKQRTLTMSEPEKATLRHKNATRHKQQRLTLSKTEKATLRHKDAKQHKQQRLTLGKTEKATLRHKDAKQHKQRTLTMSEPEKATLRHKDKSKKTQKQNDISITTAIMNFITAIKSGPDFTCVCCCRMLYRATVVHYKQHNYTKFSTASLKEYCPFPHNIIEDNWICKQCHKYLKKGSIPAQCQANELSVDKIPSQLSDLCPLEIQLISKILPFMKIVALHKGAQHGLNGQVVLVPSDITQVTQNLPRATSDSQIITLALKRRLSDKHAVHKQCIRPQYVNHAIYYLKSNSPHYSDVAINENWTNASLLENNGTPNTETDTRIQTENRNTNSGEQQHENEVNDSEDEVEAEAPPEVKEEILQKEALNSVTCFQPVHGPTIGGNEELNIAPAEGQMPTSAYHTGKHLHFLTCSQLEKIQ